MIIGLQSSLPYFIKIEYMDGYTECLHILK